VKFFFTRGLCTHTQQTRMILAIFLLDPHNTCLIYWRYTHILYFVWKDFGLSLSTGGTPHVLLELGLGPCRAGPARPSRASCCVGFRFLGTIGTSCRAVLARQVYYQAQARPMARRHVFVPCRPKHGPPDTCNWIYMHRYRNIIIAIRKHINYPWYENYMIFLNE